MFISGSLDNMPLATLTENSNTLIDNQEQCHTDTLTGGGDGGGDTLISEGTHENFTFYRFILLVAKTL